MLKVVYVLISTKEDYFAEQLLISVYSLRRVMRGKVSVTLLTDNNTQLYLNRLAIDLLNYFDEVITYEFKNQFSNKAKSRILKTKMRELIEGDFLYIDCDTVICESLEGITKIEYTSAVLDNHDMVSDLDADFKAVIERGKKYNCSVGYQHKHFNSGVIWCKDNWETHFFFKEWHELWFELYQKGVVIDQLSFNEVNSRRKGFLNELTGHWNCQLRCGLPYLTNAKIIHYFASNMKEERKWGYFFSDEKLYQAIRKNNGLLEEMAEKFNNPKAAFNKSLIVEFGTKDYILLTSNIGTALRKIMRKNIKIFFMADKVLGMLRKKNI